MSVALNKLCDVISCHSWNADKKVVALSPNNNEVHLFQRSADGYDLTIVLSEHDQTVTGIDWAPKTNRLVTSSQDRNAYVWRFENGTWKPTLVILRINRAATSCKWSPKENKFAVSSGAKVVSVCYFEVDNDWWVSKHIKKHKSTVLKVDWHPNNILIATASTDFKARVFSAYIKGVDDKPSDTPYGSKLPFGELLAEYPSNGWVHSVRWSPSGNRLAFCSHDSTLTFVDVTNGAPGEQQTVRHSGLPFVDLLWIAEDKVVAVGFDCNPSLFSCTGGAWAFTRHLDEKVAQQQQKAGATKAAFNMFKAKVEVGQDSNVTVLDTKHQNAITCIVGFGGPTGVREFSTSALDGQLGIWKV